jgi:hypothetical protein
MKKQIYISLLLFVGITIRANAQGYWQQKVDYTIDVTLNDKSHFLNGDIRMVYYNQSPDTLTEIWMHLWPNAYSTQFTALAKQLKLNKEYQFMNAPDSLYGYIDSLSFTVDAERVPFEFQQPDVDIGKITLLEPLLPGDSILIESPFRVKIPGSFSRLGHVGQSYQITQWFPKPVVYDKNGWNPMPYLDQGEFYSEYGSFDVKITLPRNYIVGATGDLQDESELNFLNALAEKTAKIDSFDKGNTEFPPSETAYKTLHYKQNNVHDFAWFADKRYHVLKGEVVLPNSQRKVTTWVMFTNAYADYWKKSIEYINDATYYYSLWNGDYLYNQVTAVDGALSAGGGMEYPNVIVIGAVGSDRSLEQVIMHEVGHNWFYGMLGSNERVHGWMDEGINTFNESRYMKTKYPEERLKDEIGLKINSNIFGIERTEAPAIMLLGYKLIAGMNKDQAIETHSADFSPTNYGLIMYGKTGLVFEYLRNYLGTALFDSCMQTYFKEWNCKHPQPEDMRAVFEKITGQDLRWFFYDVLESKQVLNHAFCRVRKKGDVYRIKTMNKSSIPTGAVLQFYTKDSLVGSTTIPPYLGKSTTTSSLSFDRIALNGFQQSPELYHSRNYYHKRGIFRISRPLKLTPIFSIEDPKRQYLFFSPVIGYNYYDRTHFGLAFYNHLLPEKKLEWEGLGFYAPHSNKFNTTAGIRYNIYTRNSTTIRKITLGAGHREFSSGNNRFNRPDNPRLPRALYVRGYAQVHFQSPAHSTRKSYLEVEHKWVDECPGYWKTNRPEIDVPDDIVYKERSYTTLRWIGSEQLYSYNHHWKAEIEQFKQRTKLRAIYTYQPLMYKRKKRAEVRAFAGLILNPNHTTGYEQGFDVLYLSNSFDYTFQRTLLEREGRFSNSYNPIDKILVSEDAGFVGDNKSTLNISNAYVSVNSYLPIPKLPFNLFINQAVDGDLNYFAESGVGISLLKNNMRILFPIVNNLQKKEIHWASQYSFRIYLPIESLNPFSLVKNLGI